MKLRTVVTFVAGMIAGSMLISPALAALGLAWKKAAVLPVVIVTYDSFRGFVPRGSDSLVPPTWKKEEVTPVTLLSYQGVGGKFVPMHTDATIVPAWSKEAVTPWVEVVADMLGDFVPRQTR